jgi:type II secretory pathway pseudopilin PulG
VIIALSLACIISAAVILVISNIISNQNRNLARMAAVKQVENALYWITEDTVQAQMVNVNSTDYLIDLQWADLSGNSHEVQYTIDTTNKALTRCYDDGAITIVASNIDINKTATSFSNGKLTIDLTADAVGYPNASESREVNIYPRTM